MSPDSENGRERGRDSWAAEGRANGQQALVALDGSLRYRTGECWLSVSGSAVLDAEQARWHRRIVFTDPVLVDNTQGQGRFVLRPVPQRERVF